MLPIFLVLLVVAIASAPYVIMLVRRMKTLNEIKSLARKCGFKVKDANKLVFFARNKGASYDLLIADKQRVFAIKLWSALHSDSTLVVCPDNTYYIARGVEEPFKQKDRGEYNLRNGRSRVPATRLTVKLRANREIIPILLLCPTYKRIMQRRGKDIVIYEQGDRIFGKRLYFADGFKELILKTAATASTDVTISDRPRAVSKKR